MSKDIKNLEQDKIRLEKIISENEQKISQLEQEDSVKDYISLIGKRKENEDLLNIINKMIDTKKMDECNHLYILREANSFMKGEGDYNKYPYCVKCGLDSSVRNIDDGMLDEKEQNMKRILKNNENHGIYGVPKGIYLSDMEGANICISKASADEIYQEIIEKNSDIDDAVLAKEFSLMYEYKREKDKVFIKK